MTRAFHPVRLAFTLGTITTLWALMALGAIRPSTDAISQLEQVQMERVRAMCAQVPELCQ